MRPGACADQEGPTTSSTFNWNRVLYCSLATTHHRISDIRSHRPTLRLVYPKNERFFLTSEFFVIYMGSGRESTALATANGASHFSASVAQRGSANQHQAAASDASRRGALPRQLPAARASNGPANHQRRHGSQRRRLAQTDAGAAASRGPLRNGGVL